MISSSLKKWGLIGLILLSVAGNHLVLTRMNLQRDQLGLTRVEPLENAPPLIAFTTVALGGFRGLLANYLWMRANTLQQEGRYFEMLTLAGWITKLQPGFGPVWAHQAWNMAYNISREFSDPGDRWRWVRNGITLLRDQGLKYNPSSFAIHRELAWFYQHKMGSFIDSTHQFYKQQWAAEMMEVLGKDGDYQTLLKSSLNEEEAQKLQTLKSNYKLDPEYMREIDEEYGPLDWRLPEAHAIYWAERGLDYEPDPGDAIRLRMIVWQSMQLAFQRGRLIDNPVDRYFEFGPNLEIVGRVDDTFIRMMEADPERQWRVELGHKNFLATAVYFLFVENRHGDAAHWFNRLKELYPDFPGLESGVEGFVVAQVEKNLDQFNIDKANAILEGLILNSFYYLAIGEDDQANGYDALARKVWVSWQTKIKARASGEEQRIGMRPFNQIRNSVLKEILNDHPQFSEALQASLRTVLQLPSNEKVDSP